MLFPSNKASIRYAAYLRQGLRSVCFAIVVLLLPHPASCLKPNTPLSQFGRTSWRTQDGALGGSPSAIAQTQDGYLWVGTDSGLMRFDGTTFVRWRPSEGAPLPAASILWLLGDRNGDLWVGTAVGLWRLHNGRVYETSGFVGGATILMQDHLGTIWVARDNSLGSPPALCQVHDDHATCSSDGLQSVGGTIYAILEDRRGVLWLGSNRHLIRFDHGQLQTYPVPCLLKNGGSEGIMTLAIQEDGSVTAGAYCPSGGLLHFTDGSWVKTGPQDTLKNAGAVTSLLVEPGGVLWVGTAEHGLYRIREGEVEHLDLTALSGTQIIQVFRDAQGDLWIVTSTGLDRLRELRVSSYGRNEGLTSGEVDSVLTRQNQSTLISEPGGIGVLSGGRFLSYFPKQIFHGGQVTSLLEDRTRTLWAGINDRFGVLTARSLDEVQRPDGGSLGLVTSATEDASGDLWVEARRQPRTLYRLHGLAVVEQHPDPEIPAARTVMADSAGGVWLGLVSGELARFNNSRLTRFSFPPHPVSVVYSLLFDTTDGVFGATDFGLIGVRDSKGRIMNSSNGLPCDKVWGALIDDHANLWLDMQCGYVELARGEVDRWWRNPSAHITPLRYLGASDGAVSGWSPFQNAAKTRDGKLWFANYSLLQMIDPGQTDEITWRPPSHIEGISADHMDYDLARPIRLPRLTRDVDIRYTGIDLAQSEKVHFRYQLIGQDRDWQDAGYRREVSYTNLRPGHYEFRVRATSTPGVWDGQAASIDFDIDPAWFQRPTVRFLALAFLACVLWLLYQARIRSISQLIAARYEERTNERNRLARELHDTLLQTVEGSRIIAEAACNQDSERSSHTEILRTLSGYLQRAADEARAALHALRLPDVENQDIKGLIKAAITRARLPSDIVVHLTFEGSCGILHPYVLGEIFWILSEALRNAAVHSKARVLSIRLHCSRQLLLEISDDGVGIPPAMLSEGLQGHFGLRGMRERAKQIGGNLAITSDTGEGTKITLSISASVAAKRKA
jgi:signal transduction histidine kinase/ligand-binding sensor domain-containing protein